MARLEMRSLRERKQREALEEAWIARALNGRKKALEQDKRSRKQKKKGAGDLFSLLDHFGVESRTVRPLHTYIPKSYNLERQKVGLIRHLYVRYDVPGFLYQAFEIRMEDPFEDEQYLFRQWFVALAQGESFSKMTRGILTGKEAHAFLSAPATHRIHENVWWAKMRVAGLPMNVIEKLLERIFSRCTIEDPDGRLNRVIRFYTRFHTEMDPMTFGEVTDFLAWKLENEPEFSLKGRTLSSVVHLTQEWHLLMQKARLGQPVEWNGLGLLPWDLATRDRFWEAFELRNNRELINEGRRQKNCVYSYVPQCLDGTSAIVSLRGYRKRVIDTLPDGEILWDRTRELNRLTIEVNWQGAVIQVRGPLNRLPDEEEQKILLQWAGAKGLTLRL